MKHLDSLMGFQQVRLLPTTHIAFLFLIFDIGGLWKETDKIFYNLMMNFKYLHLSFTAAYFFQVLLKKFLYSEIFYSVYLANTLGYIYFFIEACVTLRKHNVLKAHSIDGE
jgi:hypothetical protein